MKIHMIVAIPLVLILGLLMIRLKIFLKAHMDEKNEEIRRRFLEEYILGIKQKDTGIMTRALTEMTMYCPHSCSYCRTRRDCYRCTDKLGWKSVLEMKYGKVVTIDDVSKAIAESVFKIEDGSE